MMIYFDRVYCDLCQCSIGQLFNQSCDSSALPDFSTAPEFAVCPDCLDASEVIDFSDYRADAQFNACEVSQCSL